LTTPGLIGSWDLLDDQNNVVDKINVFVSTPVPGPLPLVGVAAAFGWSRTLRRRISASGTTTP
jgi:hypothetical protein